MWGVRTQASSARTSVRESTAGRRDLLLARRMSKRCQLRCPGVGFLDVFALGRYWTTYALLAEYVGRDPPIALKPASLLALRDLPLLVSRWESGLGWESGWDFAKSARQLHAYLDPRIPTPLRRSVRAVGRPRLAGVGVPQCLGLWSRRSGKSCVG